MATKILFLAAITSTLFGCLENEKICFDKLVSDFTSSQAFASSQIRKIPKYMKDDRQIYLDYATTASRSKARIATIFLDDDQSACDYISDGPLLRQKH